jgi:hypothetical protein
VNGERLRAGAEKRCEAVRGWAQPRRLKCFARRRLRQAWSSPGVIASDRVCEMAVPLGFPALPAHQNCQTGMRRSVNDHDRHPDLGRGFRSRSGQPSPRSPGSTAAPRRAQAAPPQGAGRHGRLPRRPGRLRPAPRLGGARPRQPLRLPPRRPRTDAGTDLLAPGGRSPPPAFPGPGGTAAPRRALPHDDGRACQGPDGGEQGGGPAALPRRLLPRGEGYRCRAAASRGSGHGLGRDAGAGSGARFVGWCRWPPWRHWWLGDRWT